MSIHLTEFNDFLITKHSFNHSMYLLANSKTVLSCMPQNFCFYKVTFKSVVDLFEPTVFNGAMALLAGARLDSDDVIALLPDSTFIMTLTKSSYETLGMAASYSKTTDRYSKRCMLKFKLLK